MAANVPLTGPISVDDGLTASADFLQSLADISQNEIATSDFNERTAYRVARLAAQALGADLPDPATTTGRIFPDAALPDWLPRFAMARSGSRGWRP